MLSSHGDDIEKQKIRLKMTGLAMVGALFHTIVCIVLLYEGLFRTTYTEFFYLFSLFWIINLSFPSLILLGINKRFQDPSMTMIQMFWGILCIMITVYLANTLRPLLLMFVLFVLRFGQFKATVRQLILILIYMIGLYGGVIYFLTKTPTAYINLKLELLTYFVFIILGIISVLITAELEAFKKHVRTKTESLEGAYKKASDESLTDELTGIKNRRFILNVLENQRELAKRENQYNFSVFILDVDFFKTINDRHGHDIGDLVLQRFCQVVGSNLRKVDYFARIGGEEFLILCTFANPKKISSTGERLRRKIEEAHFNDIIPGLKLTASIGATLFHWPESVQEVLKRADHALHIAKEMGRNQTIVL